MILAARLVADNPPTLPENMHFGYEYVAGWSLTRDIQLLLATVPAVLSGRTRQTKLVHFAAEPLRPGTSATVRITDAAPHHLRGELVDVTRAAAHKTRLPLLVG